MDGRWLCIYTYLYDDAFSRMTYSFRFFFFLFYFFFSFQNSKVCNDVNITNRGEVWDRRWYNIFSFNSLTLCIYYTDILKELCQQFSGGFFFEYEKLQDFMLLSDVLVSGEVK